MVSVPPSRYASPYLMAAPGAAFLLFYAIVNGIPFFYPDAFVYFHYGESAWQKISAVLPGFLEAGPLPGETPVNDLAASAQSPVGNASLAVEDEDWTPSAGRSVYYGVLSALPGIFSSPWNGVIIQAYCGALTAAFAWRAVMGSVGLAYLAAMAVLGLFSTFGIFASTAMPDVWAAIGILAVAILAASQSRAGLAEGILLWSFVLFSALAHSSHLAIILGLAALVGLARFAGLVAVPLNVIGKLLMVVLAAIALGAGGRMAMERAAGNPALGMPFLTAHLVDGGPGMDFIDQACPEAGFRVCEQAALLPVEWREFIFHIANPLEYRRILVEEDLSFALATLRHDPFAVVQLALRDGLRQVFMIDLVSIPVRAGIGESAAVENATSQLAQRVFLGRLYDDGWFYDFLSLTNKILFFCSLGVLAFGARQSFPAGKDNGQMKLFIMVGAGVFLNAAVCGILASPYDRFQARVAWLLPVLALMAVSAYLQDRRLDLTKKATLT